jgi:hypothetical protein
MFEVLIWSTIAVVVLGMIYAWDGAHDVFHPMMFIGPMLLFLYGWMPLKLLQANGLEGFFQIDQLIFVQTINLLGTAAFVFGCNTVGLRNVRPQLSRLRLSDSAGRKLISGGLVLGVIGLAAWLTGIRNVGGLRAAFSTAYSGGWDDNGYVRDASMLMFCAFTVILTVTLKNRVRPVYLLYLAIFLTPWVIQAIFTARRGPTFLICTLAGMGPFLIRNRRPPLVATALAGLGVGYLILFLVSNRGTLHLGSDFQFTTDVTSMIEKPDTGNEYIYGTGCVLAAEARHNFYWGKRYAAQILVRPVPKEMWPNKYADFGLPALQEAMGSATTSNAGTGEGFSEVLGWVSAKGSAPGIVSDLWIEFRWLGIPILGIIGRIYATVWRKAVTEGHVWTAQYIIMSALSIYLVMQQMEAVIFRLLILSVPVWLVWRRALRTTNAFVPEIEAYRIVGSGDGSEDFLRVETT